MKDLSLRIVMKGWGPLGDRQGLPFVLASVQPHFTQQQYFGRTPASNKER